MLVIVLFVKGKPEGNLGVEKNTKEGENSKTKENILYKYVQNEIKSAF